MDYKDYYKILGVAKTVSQDELKKAYRQLAIKYHPDKNQHNKLAEEKFKEVNEANGILSDPAKRKKYDELGENWDHYQQPYQGQSNRNSSSKNEFNNYQPYSDGHPEGNFSDFFETLFGGARQSKTQTSSGQDYRATLPVSLEEAYSGITRQIEIGSKKLNIKIKPGIQDGQELRLPGQGSKGINGSASGDLYITIQVIENLTYKRKGDDLYRDVTVDLYTALLGGQVQVQTLRNIAMINIAAETDNGKLLRLKGMGMPRYGKENLFGDLYTKVAIVLPKNLSNKEIELVKALSALKNPSPAHAI